jgi:hypothetical protein
MTRPRIVAMQVLLSVVALAAAVPARAIPAFARKYGTSCLTCHTAYPKLTPFGEAFRRNGYRFPGVDSDYVKQETVPLGQEQNKKTFPDSVWPASLPSSLPVAIGANGTMRVYPDKTASVPRGNNGTQFALDDLVGEAHLWAGAALDDTITIWAELTFSGTADVEHAQVLFNDLVGPKHAVNLVVGKGFPIITSFGAHSSYIADQGIASAPVSAMLLGSGDPFVLVDNVTGVEVSGVIEGRLDYNVGLNAGKNTFTSGGFNSENWYAHVGYKLGGMRLDGEGSTGAEDPLHPWAETALTVDGFYYHSNEHLPGPITAAAPLADVSSTVGGQVRGQLGSLELDLGYYSQQHDRGWVNGAALPAPALAKVTAGVFYGELSYVLFPWMVPAIRVERISLDPSGGASVSDLHLMPGIAFLIRPNLKLVVAGNIESTNGFPLDPTGAPTGWQGGAADWGAFVASPGPTATATTKKQEFESLAFFLAWAM